MANRADTQKKQSPTITLDPIKILKSLLPEEIQQAEAGKDSKKMSNNQTSGSNGAELLTKLLSMSQSNQTQAPTQQQQDDVLPAILKSAYADPLVQSGIKDIQKAQGLQIQEAIAQGADPTSVMANLLEQGVQRTELQNKAIQEINKQTGFLRPAASVSGQRLTNIQTAQEILGETPIQPKDELTAQSLLDSKLLDIAKDEKKLLNEDLKLFRENFFQDPKLAAESVKTISFFEQIGTDVGKLTEIFNEDPKVFERGGLLGSKANEVRRLVDRIKANLAPARGGAALSESELKLVENLLPKTGVEAKFKTAEQQADTLNALKELSEKTMKRLNPNEELRTKAQALKQQGFSDEEIFQFYRSKGFM